MLYKTTDKKRIIKNEIGRTANCNRYIKIKSIPIKSGVKGVRACNASSIKAAKNTTSRESIFLYFAKKTTDNKTTNGNEMSVVSTRMDENNKNNNTILIIKLQSFFYKHSS